MLKRSFGERKAFCSCSFSSQDWEFPHFMGDVDVNLPGLPAAHFQFRLPYFKKIFKEEYHIRITGT